jgi:hypothetical protein
VTCTPITDPHRQAVYRLAGPPEHPPPASTRYGLAEARRYGWIYEYQGQVALTGAGAYHSGEIAGGTAGG